MVIAAAMLTKLAQANKICLDFDALTPGLITEADLSAMILGVTFDNSGGGEFDVQDCTLLPDFTCGNALLNIPYANIGNKVVATFDEPSTCEVSVSLGDYNADEDDLYLIAYDEDDQVLDSDMFNNPSSSFAGTTLSVEDPGCRISYVEFYGVGGNQNSVYWDNFCFTVNEWCLDFDALTPWTTITEAALSAMVPGVNFDNSGGGDFQIQSCSLLPDFTCGNALLNSPFSTPGNKVVATFDEPSTCEVSVTMGDYNADPDDLYLIAYDEDDLVLDSEMFPNPSTSVEGTTLSVEDPGCRISYVEFYGVGGGQNSVYWDNFCFATNDNTPPVVSPYEFVSG